MDRSLGTVAQPRIQDVTTQINRTHLVYGGSDYTAPHRHASGRSLNYSSGASIHKPETERITVTPFTLRYKDSVGLFGSENHFIRVDVQVPGDIVFACYEDFGWKCATINEIEMEEVHWQMAAINTRHDVPVDSDGYLQAEFLNDSLPNLMNNRGYLSIELFNKGTGNKYNDAWLDVRLYTKNREEHPFDKMYVHPYDTFYIGFHARNTRRLAYDVECVIGKEFTYGDAIENNQLIMRR